jgi:putative ABC transport system substrate-binding protein
MFKRIVFCLPLALFLLTVAEAQQTKKVSRIGFLAAGSPFSISARTEAFRQGLRELGYVEGNNIVIEWRFAEGKVEQVPHNAAELVGLKVDAIVTAGPVDTRAAKDATVTIPIVMAFDSDPVGNGFVASLARPGGNVTGLSALSPEISGKQLELLKEIVPKLSRAAVLANSAEPDNVQSIRETALAAEALRVELQYLEVRDPRDIELALRAAGKAHAGAILALTSPILNVYGKELAELAIRSRLPAAYGRPEFVEYGGLMTYGPSMTDLHHRAATFVDKILKGAKPADLPVEQAMKFEFIINLKTAKQIGLTIPQSLLFRADRVIK